MARKNGYSYFAFFQEMIDCACEAASALNDMFGNYQPANLRRDADVIHEIEHAADLKKHDMMGRLLPGILAAPSTVKTSSTSPMCSTKLSILSTKLCSVSI